MIWTNYATLLFALLWAGAFWALWLGQPLVAAALWVPATWLGLQSPLLFSITRPMTADLYIIAVDTPDHSLRELDRTTRALLGRTASLYLVDSNYLVNVASFERAAEYHFLLNVCETPKIEEMNGVTLALCQEAEAEMASDDAGAPIVYVGVPVSFRETGPWVERVERSHRLALPATSLQAEHFGTDHEAFMRAACEGVLQALGSGEIALNPFYPEINSDDEDPAWQGLISPGDYPVAPILS